MKPWTTHPAVATLPVLARATGLLFITIGVLTLSSSYLNQWEPADEAAIQVLGGGSCLIGLLIFTMGSDRLPRSAYHLWVAIASVLVITLVGLAQGRDGPVGSPALGFLVIIDVFFIFSRFAALAHLAFLCVGQAWVLDRAGTPNTTIGLLFGLYAATGLIVAWLGRMGDSVERDPLTGLANRRGHERLLLEALDQVARDGGQLSLVLLDLDHFKEVNDTLGHLAGDQLLVTCANAWRTGLGPHQTLSRFGGDEFCLLLPHCSLGRAADLADELRRLAPDGVGVSAGVASWSHGDSASKLMSRADVALYDAKEAGRNTTAAYGDPERQASELEAAIAAGQLHMVFQPIVQLSNRQPVSCEALVRWEHPERGSLSPLEFIPMAERTGAIHALGAWTLDHACASAVTGAFRGLAVSVNVSIPELRHPDYPQFVASTLYTHALAPERLIVEVTEAVFDDDDPQVVLSLKRLRALGVKVALDDFGAGYSSLRWLERFPLDIVKVDRSFVEGLGTEREQAPVLEAILQIGAALGFRVIVEGVESQAQVEALERLGGPWAQGYYFSTPIPLVQLRDWPSAVTSPETINLRDRFAGPA
ncbi:MAG: putative bifunctional diguanylate cyclase/phosphodiesterase [Nocardioides sp.]